MAPAALPASASTHQHSSTSGEDEAMHDAPPPPPSKKRKKKDSAHTLHQSTIRSPPWSYFHLRLITPSAPVPLPAPAMPDLDALTIRALLTQPLQQYLGLTGAAIPVDVLAASGRDAWVRVPSEEERSVRAAVAGWAGSCDVGSLPGGEKEETERGKVRVSWRVVGAGKNLGVVGAGDGMDLFGD